MGDRNMNDPACSFSRGLPNADLACVSRGSCWVAWQRTIPQTADVFLQPWPCMCRRITPARFTPRRLLCLAWSHIEILRRRRGRDEHAQFTRKASCHIILLSGLGTATRCLPVRAQKVLVCEYSCRCSLPSFHVRLSARVDLS